MPIYTSHFGLAAFQWGDPYYSYEDRRRFNIIDNQLAFISDLIGEGVIYGCDIKDVGGGKAKVSTGMVMIGREAYEVNGPIEYELDNNTDHYFYLQAREGEISAKSNISDIVSIEGVDVTPPDPASGFEQVEDVDDFINLLESKKNAIDIDIRNLLGRKTEGLINILNYKEVCVKWNDIDDDDFSHFEVFLLSGSGETISSYNTEYNVYAATGLESNSEYDIEVVSVDLSGNRSDVSVFTVSTAIDTRVPSPPQNVQVFVGNGSAQIIWDASASNNVSYYLLTVQKLDDYYSKDGSPFIYEISNDDDFILNSTYTIVDNLVNNSFYDISVQSVPVSGTSYISSSLDKRFFIGDVYLAGDVRDISIEFDTNEFQAGDIISSLTWKYILGENPSGELESFPSRFEIKFWENGSRESVGINIIENVYRSSVCDEGDDERCYNLEVNYIPFETDSGIVYERIKEFTPYYVSVSAIDSSGKIGSSFVLRIFRTPVTSDIVPASNFSYERKDNNDIFLTWKNTTQGYFDYNTIDLTIVDLSSTEDDQVVFSGKNIGKSEFFLIPSEYFNINYRYEIIITPFDAFGAQGGAYSDYILIEDPEDVSLSPRSPSQLSINYQNGVCILKWDNSGRYDDEVEKYYIYRANTANAHRLSDYTLLNEISPDVSEYGDYTVSPLQQYSYFIIAENIYGRKSFNLESGRAPSGVSRITTFSSFVISSPQNLTVTYGVDSHDAVLSWDFDNSDFDGYEILFSEGNNYNFSIIGHVSSLENSYTHESALLEDGKSYYYIVRKYRNGADLVVTSSSASISNSVFIGIVKTSGGTSIVDIDISGVMYLEGYVAPITELANQEIDAHHHNISEGVDRRINLSENVEVSNWNTEDYQVYQSDEDISISDRFYLKVSGEINETYFSGNPVGLRQAQAGQSPIAYEIDSDISYITFESPLYGVSNFVNYPYSSAPSISLVLIGVTETAGVLYSDDIKGIYANQFNSGIIDKNVLPSISHEFRGGGDEYLLPVKLPTRTIDKHIHTIKNLYEDEDRNSIGTNIAFYDLAELNDGTLLAGSSRGVLVSYTAGSSWESGADLGCPVRKIFQSEDGNIYAIGCGDVYKLDGDSYRSWDKMVGLDAVKSVRDMVEDEEGNLFISTELGIYKFNKNYVPFIEYSWQKMSTWGAKSSEVFAMVLDDSFSGSIANGRLLASNDLGLLQSLDSGLSWSYVNDLPDSSTIRKFIKLNGYIFAISDDGVYRKDEYSEDFSKVAEFEDKTVWDALCFTDVIYITFGDVVVKSNGDIFDGDVEFVSALSSLKINNTRVPVFSLSEAFNSMAIGTDLVLFSMNSDGEIWRRFEQKNVISPMIFLNEFESFRRNYYYNGSSSFVFFEQMVGAEDFVSVVNKYDIYYSQFGGWSHNNAKSDFSIYRNGVFWGGFPEGSQVGTSTFSSYQFPDFDDANSNEATALVYRERARESIGRFVSSDQSAIDPSPLISQVFHDIDDFMSQLYENIRPHYVYPDVIFTVEAKKDIVSNLGEYTTTGVSVFENKNEKNGTNHNAYMNVSYGIMNSDISLTKYDDMTIKVPDAMVSNTGVKSHKQLEDKMEYIYSGLPSHLSQVQQVNILKMDIFNEINWAGEKENLSGRYQSNIYIPNSSFYDRINSSVDYKEEFSNGDPSSSLSYVSCCAYIPNSDMVLVGGYEGLFSIDVGNYEVTKKELPGNSYFIRDIYVSDYSDHIYIITDYFIYRSENDGNSFSIFNRNGLPGKIYCMGEINENLLIGGEDGIYIKFSNVDNYGWEKVKDSSSSVEFIYSSNIILTKIDGKLYLSKNGWTYSLVDIDEDIHVRNVSKYSSMVTYILSGNKIFTDNGTFNGSNIILSEIGVVTLGENETVNDITVSDSNVVVMGCSNGDLVIVKDDEMTIKDNNFMSTIHKVLFVDGKLWLFGRNLCKVEGMSVPFVLSEGSFI